MRLVGSPWKDQFEDLVSRTDSDLLISSPYVRQSACNRLLSAIHRRSHRRGLRLMLITDLSLCNLVTGVTNARAILLVTRTVADTEVRFIPTSHAKVYIADTNRAIITSANLPDAGLSRNLEYGVEIDDPLTVKAIRKDVQNYTARGAAVPEEALAALADAADRVVVTKERLDETAAAGISGTPPSTRKRGQ